MRYFGGKARTAKAIAEFLKQHRNPDQTYFEPFVGGAWILKEMADNTGPNHASDLCEPLICLYNALKSGWLPPDAIDEHTYKQAQLKLLNPALTAFIGFGCSFAGKWFGGYARGGVNRNYASNARNSLLKKLPAILATRFQCADYRNLCPYNALVYCDPPYAGTTGYSAVENFDWMEFWQTMRKWSKHNLVFISSYEAPEDFQTVLEVHTKTDIRTNANGKEKRIERLFQLPQPVQADGAFATG